MKQAKASHRTTEAEYFIFDDGKQSGPFTLSQLREKYMAREIDDFTMFAQRGAENWRRVDALFSEMFATAPKSSAMPPPPRREEEIGSHCPEIAATLAEPQRTSAPTSAPKAPVSVAKAMGVGCLMLMILFFLIPMVAMLNESPSEAAAREERSQESDAYIMAETAGAQARLKKHRSYLVQILRSARPFPYLAPAQENSSNEVCLTWLESFRATVTNYPPSGKTKSTGVASCSSKRLTLSGGFEVERQRETRDKLHG